MEACAGFTPTPQSERRSTVCACSHDRPDLVEDVRGTAHEELQGSPGRKKTATLPRRQLHLCLATIAVLGGRLGTLGRSSTTEAGLEDGVRDRQCQEEPEHF